ncbi:MAG: hypothetical protein KAS32_23370 [Candidatus Peribacteraceae bacterium]|nr:hypothetical protein [Candidatus Peribacteraceae bacterium]
MKITHDNHRGDFRTCPHCETSYPYDTWDDTAKSFSTRILFGKHSCGAIISECPKCLGESWIHIDLDSMRFCKYPKKWKTRAEKEYKKRKVVALRKWGAGLCWRCAELEDGSIDTAAHRSCQFGFGGALSECDHFKEMQ